MLKKKQIESQIKMIDVKNYPESGIRIAKKPVLLPEEVEESLKV